MEIELPPVAEIYLAILLFVLGACVGSFVTCAADRYITRESVLKGRSHCPVCGSTLRAIDLIPIFSYLFLRGKCRRCGAPIPIRCLVSEILGGLAYLAVFLKFGFSFVTLEYLLVLPALLAIALIDLDKMEIPDGLLLYLTVVFLVFLYPHGSSAERAKDACYGVLFIGGGILLLSLLMDFLLKRESMGGGDVKFFLAISLFTGFAKGVLLVIASCLIGLLFAWSRRGNQKKEFPFGPAISIAAMFTLFVGQELIDWYLSLIL